MTLFSTFGLFVTLSLLIALIFALIAIMPWLRAPRLQSKPIDNQLLDINVAVFRERLAELQTDKDSGTINNSHYQNQKLELERQLLDVQRQITPMVTPDVKKPFNCRSLDPNIGCNGVFTNRQSYARV
ncbi:c-type cytochrome biogenesis protein CcmI [Psychrobacter sp. VH5]|uniref:c-type cytochrome biogenesis protein CcmI n=1 Tax=Psychrobacter sp. VH5 TaxID=3423439 RepID=UPI003D64931A